MRTCRFWRDGYNWQQGGGWWGALSAGGDVGSGGTDGCAVEAADDLCGGDALDLVEVMVDPIRPLWVAHRKRLAIDERQHFPVFADGH